MQFRSLILHDQIEGTCDQTPLVLPGPGGVENKGLARAIPPSQMLLKLARACKLEEVMVLRTKILCLLGKSGEWLEIKRSHFDSDIG